MTVRQSRIIVPLGEIVKRITIEIDTKGMCQVTANSFLPNAMGRCVKGPMDALEVAMILNAMAGTSLAQVAQTVPMMKKEANADSQKGDGEAGAASPGDNAGV